MKNKINSTNRNRSIENLFGLRSHKSRFVSLLSILGLSLFLNCSIPMINNSMMPMRNTSGYTTNPKVEQDAWKGYGEAKDSCNVKNYAFAKSKILTTAYYYTLNGGDNKSGILDSLRELEQRQMLKGAQGKIFKLVYPR
jgi:hypothetical protein